MSLRSFLFLVLMGVFVNAAAVDEIQKQEVESYQTEYGFGGSVGHPVRLGLKGVWHPGKHPWGAQISFGRQAVSSSVLGQELSQTLIRIEARREMGVDDYRWYPFLGPSFLSGKLVASSDSSSAMYASGGAGIEARALPGGGVGAEFGFLYKLSGPEDLSGINVTVNFFLMVWLN